MVVFDSFFSFRFAFKVVITSTVVYWTNQLEVWSQLSQKERAYDKLIGCAKALIAKNTPGSLKLKVNCFFFFLSVGQICYDYFSISHFAILEINNQKLMVFVCRYKKFKMINYCYALRQITITIKV